MDDEIEFTGEDNLDDVEIEETEANTGAKLKQTKKKLKETEQEKMQALEDLQRAKADFLNTRKRLEEDAVRSTERTRNDFIESLLPLCDSFDMAMADQKAWQSIDESWRTGVEAIKTQLDSILKQHSVETFGASDEAFDPLRHEAMSTVDGEGESETVAEVLQKGYERNGNVIRPAKVIIYN